MAKYPGLYARSNGAWYVRKRTPVDLILLEQRSQVRLSLETSDKKLALRRYHPRMSAIDRHFEALRNGLQSKGATGLALATGKIERLDHSALERLVSGWWEGRGEARKPVVEDPAEFNDLVSAVEDDARVLGGSPTANETVCAVADGLLVASGMAARPHRVGTITTQTSYPVVNRSTEAYAYLCDLVARALASEVALAKDHLLRRREAPFDALFNPVGNMNLLTEGRSLADLSVAYRAYRANSSSYSEADLEKRYGFPFRVMSKVLGEDKPVASITRSDCVAIRRYFERIPPNAKKRFPTLTLEQVITKADEDGLARLAPNSVASYMQTVLAMLRWAEDEGWGIKVNPRDVIGKRNPTVKRRRFEIDELRLLFDALAGFRASEPEKFWVPALALFTGARAGEICQLRVEDVVEIEGVPCLNLSLFDADGRRVEDKRLKTETSERFVPIHPRLMEGGFADFVAELDATSRVFPKLQKGPDGRYSHAFSKWFGRFKKSVGFGEPALVFHSFRHGFRDACRKANISDETAHALGGWASSNEAAKYGDRGMVPVLNDAIRKVDFGGFSLPTT